MKTTRNCLLVIFSLLVTACTSGTPHPSVTAQPTLTPAERDYRSGNEFAARGDWVRAEQYLASAMRNGYPESEIMPKLLRVCLGASRLRAALGYAQMHLLRHPDAWSLRYLAATIDLALGQCTEARSEVEEVLRVQPSHAPSVFLLAEIESTDPSSAGAELPLYEQYLTLEPRGPHAHDARAYLHAHRIPAPSPKEVQP